MVRLIVFVSFSVGLHVFVAKLTEVSPFTWLLPFFCVGMYPGAVRFELPELATLVRGTLLNTPAHFMDFLVRLARSGCVGNPYALHGRPTGLATKRRSIADRN